MVAEQQSRTAITRLLSLAARADRTDKEGLELRDLYSSIGVDAAFAAAATNKVLPSVAHALVMEMGRGLEDPRWQKALAANRARVAKLVSALSEVLQALAYQRVAAAVIENGGVLLASGLPYEMFSAGDFDLLIDSERMNEVRQTFDSLGFREANRRDRITNRLEYCRNTPDGDCQWINPCGIPFDRFWIPLPFTDRSAVWLRRRVQVPGLPFCETLEPSDALVLVAVHTSLHSYVRSPFLRLYTDIDWLVRRCSIDWSTVVQESRLIGMPTRVWLSLLIARTILETPIPEGPLLELQPPGSKADKLVHLIMHEGVVSTERRKLTGANALKLDALLSEDGVRAWLERLVWPDHGWLTTHFDRGDAGGVGRLRLALRRAAYAAMRWRPE